MPRHPLCALTSLTKLNLANYAIRQSNLDHRHELCSLLYAIFKEQPRLRGKMAVRGYREVVGVPGLEPGTSSLSGTRSNQLSYTPDFAEAA